MSSEELAKSLKQKFKKFLNQENVSPANVSTGKNVSWAEIHDYDSKQKKPFRSTPYPNPRKKMKISNSTPKTLSFDDSDQEDQVPKECSFTTAADISKLCKPKSQGTKRKRTQNVPSGWTVTSCNQIKPDKSNKRCIDYNATVSFESNGDDSTVVSPIISEDRDNCIILSEKIDPVEFQISSEDESSDFGAEQIFKPKIMNLEKCQIIQLKTKLPTDEDQIFENNDSIIENNETIDENNESLVENNEPVAENNIEVPKPIIRFSKVVKTFMNETHCILFLKHPLKVYFHGKLSVTVLSGAVEILGHILNFEIQKEIDIFSPKGHSYLCFETVEFKENSREKLQNILSSYKMPSKLIKDYLYHLGKHDCVIAISNLNNNLTNYLSTHVAQYLFPKPVQCEKTIEKKLHCLFEIEEATWNWKIYRKHENWPRCIEMASTRLSNNNFPCTMLCGGKSVGKSTLYRYMINSLLNRVSKVVCIDLDLGQSEFTIGGCISITLVEKPLLGPNFTHLQTPDKSFFVGDVNVVNCIDRYISSVKELLIYCERNVSKSFPWVVNFMGFSKSLGTDLTVSVIKLINPNTVIQINSSMRSRNYPAYLTAEYVQNYIHSFPIIVPERRLTYNMQVLSSMAEEKIEDFQFEARHLREMSILAYFSQMVDGGKEVTSVPPYGIKLSSIKLHDLSYSKENLAAVINGNLVALCKTKVETIDSQTVFDCLGFGIVRGIDVDSGELYLLTPVPEIELDNVNSLIRGNINLPPSLYMTTGRQGLVPYILLGTQQGTSSIPKRSYRNLKTLLYKK